MGDKANDPIWQIGYLDGMNNRNPVMYDRNDDTTGAQMLYIAGYRYGNQECRNLSMTKSWL